MRPPVARQAGGGPGRLAPVPECGPPPGSSSPGRGHGRVPPGPAGGKSTNVLPDPQERLGPAGIDVSSSYVQSTCQLELSKQGRRFSLSLSWVHRARIVIDVTGEKFAQRSSVVAGTAAEGPCAPPLLQLDVSWGLLCGETLAQSSLQGHRN